MNFVRLYVDSKSMLQYKPYFNRFTREGKESATAVAALIKFQLVLEQIDTEICPLLGRDGIVASYIPALARVPVAQFSIALRTHDNLEACAGDADTPLSVQSVSELFTLTLAMLCVWFPARDAVENSLLGMKALELFVGVTGLAIF